MAEAKPLIVTLHVYGTRKARALATSAIWAIDSGPTQIDWQWGGYTLTTINAEITIVEHRRPWRVARVRVEP